MAQLRKSQLQFWKKYEEKYCSVKFIFDLDTWWTIDRTNVRKFWQNVSPLNIYWDLRGKKLWIWQAGAFYSEWPLQQHTPHPYFQTRPIPWNGYLSFTGNNPFHRIFPRKGKQIIIFSLVHFLIMKPKIRPSFQLRAVAEYKEQQL